MTVSWFNYFNIGLFLEYILKNFYSLSQIAILKKNETPVRTQQLFETIFHRAGEYFTQ